MIQPPNMPTKSAMMVSSGSMTAVAIQARRDQLLNRVGAERAHGVDLLGDFHGAEFAGDAGGIAAGHHQRRQHRAQFAHQGDRDHGPVLPTCP